MKWVSGFEVRVLLLTNDKSEGLGRGIKVVVLLYRYATC